MSVILKHMVGGKQYKTEEEALIEFWRRMAVSTNKKRPQEYITIDSVEFDKQVGWTITYVADVEVDEKKLPAAPEPKPRPKCHVLTCMAPCIEGSSYCAQHQDKDSRFADTAQPNQLMPSLIVVSGWNPRKDFNQIKLDELKASILEHGILEPLIVRPKGTSRWELVVGERRLRAARELKLEHVPVTVRQLTDEQVLEIMLAENLQREDLSPIEEAHHLKRVIEMSGQTQTELGRRIGKSQEWVSLRLRLAEAPSDLQDLIIGRLINPTSVIDLLAWVNTDHFSVLKNCVKEELDDTDGITVKRVREIIKEITEPPVVIAEYFTDKDGGNIEPLRSKPKTDEIPAAPTETLPEDDADQKDLEVGTNRTNEILKFAKEGNDGVPKVPEASENQTKEKPKFTVGSGTLTYNAKLFGSSNGDIRMESGPEDAPRFHDLSAVIAEAVGCEEGDTVPITVVIKKGWIQLCTRGNY